MRAYVDDLANVIDMDAIRSADVRIGVDPLGGASVHYWAPIAERYGLDITIRHDWADATFRFMTLDWDGKIRMDPSSSYAMQGLIALKDSYDVAFACDTDHGAVVVARENFERARVPVPAFVGSADSIASGTADIVVANISPAWIAELAPEWMRILKPGGVAILSGFEAADVAVISAAIAKAGGHVAGQFGERDWRMLEVIR